MTVPAMPENCSESNRFISAPESRSLATCWAIAASNCSVSRRTLGLCGKARRNNSASWKRMSDSASPNSALLIETNSFSTAAAQPRPWRSLLASSSDNREARLLFIYWLADPTSRNTSCANSGRLDLRRQFHADFLERSDGVFEQYHIYKRSAVNRTCTDARRIASVVSNKSLDKESDLLHYEACPVPVLRYGYPKSSRRRSSTGWRPWARPSRSPCAAGSFLPPPPAGPRPPSPPKPAPTARLYASGKNVLPRKDYPACGRSLLAVAVSRRTARPRCRTSSTPPSAPNPKPTHTGAADSWRPARA